MFNFQKVSSVQAASLSPKVTLKHSSSRFTFTQGAIQKIGYDHENESHGVAVYVDPQNKLVAFRVEEDAMGTKRLSGKDNNSFSNKVTMESVLEITDAEELKYAGTVDGYVIFNKSGELEGGAEEQVTDGAGAQTELDEDEAVEEGPILDDNF